MHQYRNKYIQILHFESEGGGGGGKEGSGGHQNQNTKELITWHACKYRVHKLHQRYVLVEFMCLAFTRMPGESYSR